MHNIARLIYAFLKVFLFGKFTEYLSFSLTQGHVGTKASKCYSSYKSLPNYFKHLPNFVLSGPHESTGVNFEILELQICRKL